MNNLRTPERIKKALEYAQQAVERDPTYAPTYAMLARAYLMMGGHAFLSSREAMSRATTAAMKALEIDEALPEAHEAPGWVRALLDWDWAGADRAYRRAIELNPNSPDAHFGYSRVAFIHAGLGEKEQAFEWLEKAYAERDQGMLYLKVDPTLDPLRSDPRFHDLLRRMNFPS